MKFTVYAFEQFNLLSFLNVQNYIWSLFFPLVDPCHRYKTLNSSDKNIKTQLSGSSCDDSLAIGWYRFQGDAGTRLPTECPPINRCHTTSPGWVDVVSTPLPPVGVTTQILVCFQGVNNDNCYARCIPTDIKNCSSYFVYMLGPTSGCNYRYCGID